MDDMNDFKDISSRLEMIWIALACGDMNDSRLWDQGSRCYKQLKALDDKNESGLWA